MKKNWERFAKVFSHKQVTDDGPVYPNQCPLSSKEK
jgi:hypothetical protein